MMVNPPQEAFQYKVTDSVNEDGETIIAAFDYCGSSFDSSSGTSTWYNVSRAAVILPAGMIALMSLRVREDMNDTKSMSLVLFIHIVMLVVGIVLLVVWNEGSNMMGYASLVLSVDVVLSIGVYCLPKFLNSGEVLDTDPLPDVFVNTTVVLTEEIGLPDDRQTLARARTAQHVSRLAPLSLPPMPASLGPIAERRRNNEDLTASSHSLSLSNTNSCCCP
jgi:hypothetical protein